MICGGECSGAKAAKARYEKRAKQLKKRGKKSAIDKNWRNSSYACTCHTEYVNILCMYIVCSYICIPMYIHVLCMPTYKCTCM